MYNISYLAIIVIWLQVMYASTRIEVLRLGWMSDNVNPRISIDEMERSGKYKAETIARLRRRQSAHENGFEALPMFIAAVVRSGGTTAPLPFLQKICVLTNGFCDPDPR